LIELTGLNEFIELVGLIEFIELIGLIEFIELIAHSRDAGKLGCREAGRLGR
jgi:hypothetical protein